MKKFLLVLTTALFTTTGAMAMKQDDTIRLIYPQWQGGYHFAMDTGSQKSGGFLQRLLSGSRTAELSGAANQSENPEGSGINGNDGQKSS